MATKTKTSQGNKDWTDFFSAKGGGILQDLFDQPFEANDDVTFSYLLDGQGLMDSADTYPYNWLLVPGPGKTILLFHSCFATTGKLVGINGCRSTAPFKAIRIAAASASITVPPTIRGNPDPTLPTLEQFLNVSEEEDFSNLVGNSKNPISDLARHPNSFWMHPSLFLTVSGPQSVRAAELASLILLSIEEGRSGDLEAPTEDEIGIYNLLLFLWAVEKRWTTPVVVQDPLDTQETFTACESVALRLNSWRDQLANNKSPRRNDKKSQSSDDDSSNSEEDPPKRKARKKQTKKRKTRSSSDESLSDRSDRRSRTNHRASRKGNRSPSRSNSSPSDSSSSSTETSRDRRKHSSRRNDKKQRRRARKDSDTSPSPSPSDSSSSSDSSRDGRRGRRKRNKRTRRRRRSRPQRRSRRHSGSSSEDLRVEMMQSLVEMNKFQKKAYKRDSQKKSMLNRLPEEQVKLYTLLSAQDWHDRRPKMNSFTEDLLSDRDPERAWNHLETISRDWPGEVSKTGLIHFLSKGFRASDVDESPGGFTAFMFSSVDVDKKVSRKDRELAIRSVFGEDTVTDEVVRYYAKNDLFLASSYEDTKNQLRTCLKCLEKLTYKGSIGTAGYSYGIDLLSRHRRKFMKESKRDPQIYIKFVYMLDRVFQNFISRLGSFYRDRDPIPSAKGSLRGSMQADIDQALGGFDSGVIPNLSLPEVISNHSPPENSIPEKKKPDAAGRTLPDDLVNPPSWWSENPEKVAEWGLPASKNYRDFFTPDNKANFAGWPKFKHHRHPRVPDTKPLCIKYQSTGSCRAGCRLAHVKPSSMDQPTRDLVSKRYKEIFKRP